MTRDHRDFVNDLHQAISDIESFTEGMERDSFLRDRKTINAVIRSLEVLGEAARNIPEAIRMKYPAIPWKNIIGMRNKLIHEYFGVDVSMVWETIRIDLLPLKASIAGMYARESSQSGPTQ
jgi:uncharacterized protein with HEPN domain